MEYHLFLFIVVIEVIEGVEEVTEKSLMFSFIGVLINFMSNGKLIEQL